MDGEIKNIKKRLESFIASSKSTTIFADVQAEMDEERGVLAQLPCYDDSAILADQVVGCEKPFDYMARS